ncbi:MAG: sugar-transfer associated ATP-grasp domain-containing protein, partial [Gammaproteobacteria bacterium]|nr:sugar-transfer associated ATP-grasp domain-containing protein [Gammaproteobacteria bacterium]
AVAGDFREGWIPDNYYGEVVIPSIQGLYKNLSPLKASTNQLFQSNVFPDLAYYINGLFLTKNCTVINESDVKDILFSNSELVVYKLENSAQGRGIFFFDRNSFDTKKLQELGNGVFQDHIDQHKFFKECMPSSVVTLRITTIIDDLGNASVRACYLRIGRSEDTHVKSSSNIRISVDSKTGELDTLGYLTSWVPIERHPDTGIVFAGKRIPMFSDCISVALELQRLIPFVRCVGWDVVLDKESNVKVMEWNSGHNDIKFSEATQGPCFSDLGWEKLWQQ